MHANLGSNICGPDVKRAVFLIWNPPLINTHQLFQALEQLFRVHLLHVRVKGEHGNVHQIIATFIS